MKTNDYVQFLTKTLMEQLDTPKEERKKRRIEKKQLKTPKLYHWFGIMPYAMRYELKKIKIKKR